MCTCTYTPMHICTYTSIPRYINIGVSPYCDISLFRYPIAAAPLNRIPA